jgi:hypothetical protein
VRRVSASGPHAKDNLWSRFHRLLPPVGVFALRVGHEVAHFCHVLNHAGPPHVMYFVKGVEAIGVSLPRSWSASSFEPSGGAPATVIQRA